MTLPEKPADVAHVSDVLWESALRKSWDIFSSKRPGTVDFEQICWPAAEITPTIIDHARCLILLKEVVEPVDPVEAAICSLFEERCGTLHKGDDWYQSRLYAFSNQCRKHFAGRTFPQVQS